MPPLACEPVNGSAGCRVLKNSSAGTNRTPPSDPSFLERTLGSTALHTDPACDKADADESERETPHVQPEPPISANPLAGEQRQADAGYECAEHVAPRGRRRACG